MPNIIEDLSKMRGVSIENVKKEVVQEKIIDAEGNNVVVKKEIITCRVTRPKTMKDIRAQWKPFGVPINMTVSEKTKQEGMINLELGAVDPTMKACRDELIGIMGDLEQQVMKIKDPQLQKAQRDLREAKTAAMKKESSAAAAKAAGASVKGKLTWADGRATAKAGAVGSSDSVGTGRSIVDRETGKIMEVDPKAIKVSNLHADISESELRRLFGPLNGLGNIARFFLPMDRKVDPPVPLSFCFISYFNEKHAKQAVEMGKITFKNAILKIEPGTTRPQASGDGGRGGRGRVSGRGRY
eukprot:Tbor_TRINITY_DN547_c0_g1::TRINITY_DN547_c0_g1_i1::g.23341::m.23341